MLEWLWLIPGLPLAGFVALVLAGGALSRRASAAIGVGSVGLSALTALAIGIRFIGAVPPGAVHAQTLWTWMAVGGFTPGIGLVLDPLSLVFVLVITVIGLLIHVYSTEFMAGDPGYARFFAYLNLFVACMLILVLADNLLLLYLGWEGVGLCSYLLIGFWFEDPVNGRAARKAFIVTRVGDAAMAIGLFLLYAQLGTLEIRSVLARAPAEWVVGSGIAVAASALLLAGALGKSAQLPLQTWLPDAMAGPTPVSALIHAATMVTAGVYLIARMHVLYTLAPAVQWAVAVIGALTLLVAGCSALAQRDLKRVLAYSTISQIGLMFLALGVGAWSAAIFHFMTHACFKALLFLGAGAIIKSLHHEHDIFRMGGLRRHCPVTFWTFLIGCASLAGLPLVTAGFYSKDWILWEVWSSEGGWGWLWATAALGALLTSIYAFRLVMVVFFGEAKTEPVARPGLAMRIPLIMLASLSIVAGFIELPHTLGHVPLFSGFLEGVLPAPGAAQNGIATELALQAAAAGISLLGIALAYVFFLRSSRRADALARTTVGGTLHRLWYAGWGFDWLYDRMLVQPFVWLADVNREDVMDALSRGAAGAGVRAHRALSRTQTGRVRQYAAAMVVGSVVILAIVLLS
jgi:NADH-quinone oxidoreductase subunit L